ncbi:MFS transporter [Glutamicibacter sp. AOP5-A2-18]|uniref:MFS transporter n=1 Tax=Glutamicibacter sp. AOP5-A2-18 TaxID=3457656 RepID=UPI0040338DEC
MPSPDSLNASADSGSQGRTPVKAAVASFMGSAVEYYDFFIFGSAAALIFPHIFFPGTNTNAAVMSLATFGFAYVARPVGAIFVGHFGDRIGRQKVLMFTLILMGGSTFLIGCLPTFDQVGWLAPILLVFARLCQGLSAAGEQAGASSMSLEHAPDNRRSFFTSWTLTGTQGGQILAAMIFIPVVALPDEIKYGIGWRIPFWLSALVVIVTFFIRRSLNETPEFEEAKKNNEIAKLPLAVLLRFHWKDVLRVVFCAFIAAVSTVYGTLAISYGKTIGNMDESITLWLVVAGNIGALITQPFFGMLADKIGRKPVFIYGALASAAIMPFYLRSMESSNALLQFTLSVLVFSCAYAAANSVWPSFYGEMFSSQVRFSGLAIGTQLGFLMAGFAPSIVAALGGLEANGWIQISLFTATISVVASISALTARETYRVPTKELGHIIQKVS